MRCRPTRSPWPSLWTNHSRVVLRGCSPYEWDPPFESWRGARPGTRVSYSAYIDFQCLYSFLAKGTSRTSSLRVTPSPSTSIRQAFVGSLRRGRPTYCRSRKFFTALLVYHPQLYSATKGCFWGEGRRYKESERTYS
jgi:hypothetical protein